MIKTFFKTFIDDLPSYLNNDIPYMIEDIGSITNKLNLKKNHVSRMLLVGQVQSGKTNAIIGTMCKALDTNYDMIIILGGVNGLLLEQTLNRVVLPLSTNDDLRILLMNKDEIKSKAKERVRKLDLIENPNIKKVLITMKEKSNLEYLIKLLNEINTNNMNILVIDDEADNASLNNEIKGVASTIYEMINRMNSTIAQGTYIAVTATPFANLVTSKSSMIYPSNISYLRPGLKYTGLDFFNLHKKNVYKQINYTKTDIDYNRLIGVGFSQFLVNSFMMNKLESVDGKHEFLININLDLKSFTDIKSAVLGNINKILASIHSDSYLKRLEHLNCIVEEWIEIGLWKTDYYDCLRHHIVDVITCLSDGKAIEILYSENKGYISGEKKYSVIIGGGLISRGFTFNNLLVEVMLNAPKEDISADTLLQRARWFGYRRLNNRYKYMRVLMSSNIISAYDDSLELNKLMINYINDVNLNKKRLCPEVARDALGNYDFIIPSRKK